MTEKQPSAGDWIGSWIEQQRQRLHESRAGGGHASFEALGQRWLDLGESYLKGLAQYGQMPDEGTHPGSNSGPAAAEFKLGDDLLAAWRKAWAGAEQGHAGIGRIAELMDHVPFLGLAREQAQAWRELALAQAECRRLSQELATVLSRVQSDALSLLEQRVREREQSGQPVSGFRALYDLWVECGENVYAQVAHSEAYSKLQAELGNATMRLRSRQQAVLEHVLRQFDLPTRTELNSVHLQLRELRAKVAAIEAAHGSAPPASEASRAAARVRKKETTARTGRNRK